MSELGLHKLLAKVNAIRHALRPTNVTQLLSFLAVIDIPFRCLHPATYPQHLALTEPTLALVVVMQKNAFNQVKDQITSDIM